MDDQRNAPKNISQLNAEIIELKMDIAILAVIGRMYVAAIKADIDAGLELSLPDTISVSMVEEIVNRWYYDRNSE